jgi:hypothetical protein
MVVLRSAGGSVWLHGKQGEAGDVLLVAGLWPARIEGVLTVEVIHASDIGSTGVFRL